MDSHRGKHDIYIYNTLAVQDQYKYIWYIDCYGIYTTIVGMLVKFAIDIMR